MGSREERAEGTEWRAGLLLSLPGLVVVAALPFSALWDGAGHAGAAPLQTERSTNLPAVQLCRAGVQTTPGTPFLVPFPGLRFRSILSSASGICSSDFPEKDQGQLGPVLLCPTWVQYLGIAQVLDLSSELLWAVLQGRVPDVNLVCKAGAAG